MYDKIVCNSGVLACGGGPSLMMVVATTKICSNAVDFIRILKLYVHVVKI